MAVSRSGGARSHRGGGPRIPRSVRTWWFSAICDDNIIPAQASFRSAEIRDLPHLQESGEEVGHVDRLRSHGYSVSLTSTSKNTFPRITSTGGSNSRGFSSTQHQLLGLWMTNLCLRRCSGRFFG